MNTTQLLAGSAVTDITPLNPQFLYGYPRVPRMSTGVHDPLLASALYLESAGTGVLYIANDILWVNKATVARVRQRISEATGIPGTQITVSCTHTHSGPITFDCIISEADPAVPPVDPAYVAYWEDRMVEAGIAAWKSRRPAVGSCGVADAKGIGTNRHHPDGPSDLAVPVLCAREAASGQLIAVMVVCAMHPTVLHEDSTLVSGDFPGEARAYLRANGVDCPFLYHIGAAGDQSPRHVTRANTFDESKRLGEILGRAVTRAVQSAQPIDPPTIAVRTALIDLPVRQFPSVSDARDRRARATARFQSLRDSGAPRTEVRTAECDMFGADETVVLAQAAATGRLKDIARTMLPAEIQVVAIGPLRYVAWPGEVFVDFALRVKEKYPTAAVLTLANGDLQAYLVTQQAVDENWYEAGNAIFQSPKGGNLLVETTLKLLSEMH